MKSFAVLLLLFALLISASPARAVEDGAYLPGQIILKFTDDVDPTAAAGAKDAPALGIPSLDQRMRRFGVRRLQPLFPHKSSQLGRICQIDFPPEVDVLGAADAFARDPHVLYAEPRYIDHLCTMPSDPDYLAGMQWYLDHVQAPQAWDVARSGGSAIIAIVDQGVDWNHPDLAENMWINPGEDLDGDGQITGVDFNLADDDSNGYADDFFGWDFGGYGYPDWNPMENPGFYPPHGTHCAGIAAAVTDNALGVAGMSWNCSIMAVKVTEDESNAVYYGYEGIQYAADNGADVINVSWGRSVGNPSQVQQEIIDSAFARGCIIVAAAGNDPGVLPPDTCGHYWPAWYDHVTAVAAIDQDDHIPDWSYYGDWVDVCAPGVDIYNTFWDDTYGSLYGTSMAVPVVAGVAGLARKLQPDMDSDQFESLMRTTSDDIESLNPGYEGWLGGGRLNAYQALQENVAVVLTGFQAVAGTDHIQLSWTTASETDCHSWEIHRSPRENGGFVRMAVLPGRGSTELEQHYRWIDRQVAAGQTYHYKLKQVDLDGSSWWSDPVSAAVSSAGAVPRGYALDQNYPNPFNPGTNISYCIPEYGPVALRIFNVRGQLVRTLAAGGQNAGWHQTRWDGRDAAGRQVASGLYFCRLEAGDYRRTIKMALVR
jgi:subtilisin family serine protease